MASRETALHWRPSRLLDQNTAQTFNFVVGLVLWPLLRALILGRPAFPIVPLIMLKFVNNPGVSIKNIQFRRDDDFFTDSLVVQRVPDSPVGPRAIFGDR